MTTPADDWCEVTLNGFLGCDASSNEDWIDTAKLHKHSLRPGQGFKNNYHTSQSTDWNKLIDICTQRETISFCKPQTETELREQCVSAISSNDYTVTEIEPCNCTTVKIVQSTTISSFNITLN